MSYQVADALCRYTGEFGSEEAYKAAVKAGNGNLAGASGCIISLESAQRFSMWTGRPFEVIPSYMIFEIC